MEMVCQGKWWCRGTQALPSPVWLGHAETATRRHAIERGCPGGGLVKGVTERPSMPGLYRYHSQRSVYRYYNATTRTTRTTRGQRCWRRGLPAASWAANFYGGQAASLFSERPLLGIYSCLDLAAAELCVSHYYYYYYYYYYWRRLF